MSFTQKTFTPISAQSNSDSTNAWTYRTGDDEATLEGANYFIKKINEIKDGDALFGQSSEGPFLAAFTNDGETIQLTIRQQGVLSGADVGSVPGVEARSFDLQTPAGLGIANKRQVSFGAAQPPALDANGTYTAQEDGQRTFAVGLSFQRLFNNMETCVWVYRAVNDVVTTTELIRIDGNKQRETFAFTTVETMLKNDEVKFYFYLDPMGASDGTLAPAINGDGLPDAPAATLEVTKMVII